MALNWSELETTTREMIDKRLVDNVYNSHPALIRLRKKQKAAPGGRKIVQPLMVSQNPNKGSFQRYDKLDIDPYETISAAEFPWARLYVSVVLDEQTIDENSGSEEKVIDILETKMEQAELDMADMLHAQLWGDGTGNNGKDLLGLLPMIDDGTTYATYGGIDRSTNAFWKAKVKTSFGAFTLRKLQSFYGSVSDGTADQPDLLLMQQDIYDEIWAALQAQQRFIRSDEDLAKAGFDSILFNKAACVVDNRAPAGEIFALNTKYIHWRPHKDYAKSFRFTGWKRNADQDARFGQIIWFGNLTGSRCNRQGVAKGVLPADYTPGD